MRISIVTPTYNQAPFIERTIRSVLEQEGDFELEYLVVDGGSTDGTVDILKSHAGRLEYISERDNGPTDAIAKGFRAAGGDIVAWINSDDTYCEGAFQRAVEAFEAAPDAQWLAGSCRIIDPEDREMRGWITRYKNWWLRRYSLRALLVLNFISQPATFFRRGLIEEIGVPDDECSLAFDYAYWLRIAPKHRPLIVDEDLACFRWYPDSLSGANARRQFQEECAAARKYNPGYALTNGLHRLHAWGIVAAYRVMRLFG